MSLTLRGVQFGSVFQASGATNFDGRGYWYHKLLRPFGLNFDHYAFVAKTTTLLARAGNMPLKEDGVTPKEWLPRSIIVKRSKRAVLNAVSLSGPGLEFLLKSDMWQRQAEPFQISVMSLAKTPGERRNELREIFWILSCLQPKNFRSAWGIQVNFSCPNGGLDPNDLVDEAVPVLEMADKILPLWISVMPKFGPEIHPQALVRISKEPRCDAICVFNTMPFGRHPAWAGNLQPIDWKGIFGTDDPKESPMAKRFPGFAGGYSGEALLPFLIEWLHQVRRLGIRKPICGGGGILSPEDAIRVFDAGADAVFLGSIAMLAPTQVAPTILEARRYAFRQEQATRTPVGMEYNV